MAMVNADSPQSKKGLSAEGRGVPLRRPLLEMWLTADPQAVPAARHRALDICRKAGFSEDDCLALDLALGEALANAVVHGIARDRRPGEAAQDICLSIWDYHDRLIIEVHDHGPGFDPPLPPYAMPPADAGETHGRGLPLMQLLTDAFVICRGNVEEGGASIYLVKALNR